MASKFITQRGSWRTLHRYTARQNRKLLDGFFENLPSLRKFCFCFLFWSLLRYPGPKFLWREERVHVLDDSAKDVRRFLLPLPFRGKNFLRSRRTSFFDQFLCSLAHACFHQASIIVEYTSKLCANIRRKYESYSRTKSLPPISDRSLIIQFDRIQLDKLLSYKPDSLYSNRKWWTNVAPRYSFYLRGMVFKALSQSAVITWPHPFWNWLYRFAFFDALYTLAFPESYWMRKSLISRGWVVKVRGDYWVGRCSIALRFYGFTKALRLFSGLLMRF